MPSTVKLGTEFVQRCASAKPEICTEDFLSTIRRIGFDSGAGGAWVGVGKNRRHRFFFVDWPRDWLDFYQQGGWFEHDGMPIEARRRIAPFRWSEIRDVTPLQRSLYDAGWAYGWREVFAVPIHGPGNLQGLVTMATRRELSLSVADFAILEMMSRAVWERCRTAEGFGIFDPQRSRLSPRELECLQWAAAGKSDAEIGLLIGISSATAHFHIEKAKKRLGVKTRVEAVAVGVLHGVI